MIILKYFSRRSVHSFLGLSDSPPLSKCGLGLITNETPPRVSSNIIESSSILPKPSPQPPEKKIGFIDDMGGGVDGLMSCTESLGFESCDERRVDDDDENEHVEFCEGERERRRRKRGEEKRERKKEKKFPPPLSSLKQNGQPRFYLKPVRQNGRLELTEVRIQRPEILCAVRENGRLRLHLVSTDVCSKINDEEEEDENEEIKQEDQEQLELHLHEEEEEEEKKVEQVWNYRVSGECWRCQELGMTHYHHDHDHNHHHDCHNNNHHHHHISDHHSLHVWRQPCVTTS